MNILETLNLLDEVYEVKTSYLDNVDNYYHYFTGFGHLLDSLNDGLIISSLNTAVSQLDITARRHDDAGYVCMLKGATGKRRISIKFGRNFGLSFKDLGETCKRQHYILDDHGFNQVWNKLSTDSEHKYTTTDEMLLFNDFRISAIGKLADGKYFVSGGQGRSLKHFIASELFTDEHLYNTLRKWFMTNIRSDRDTKYCWYWFKNNNFGTATEQSKEKLNSGKIELCTLNLSGNLNKNYIPWIDTKESDKKNKAVKVLDNDQKLNARFRKSANDTHKSAIRFDGPGFIHKVAFEEIIGCGPLCVVDEYDNPMLQINLVIPGQSGGYSLPKMFGYDWSTEKYSDKDTINPPSETKRKGSADYGLTSLSLTKDTVDKITGLFNEDEYRVYIPNKRHFRFKPSDIATIVLPEDYEFDSSKHIIIHLRTIVELLMDKPTIFNEVDLETALINYDCVSVPAKNQQYLAGNSLVFIEKFIKLLKGQYANVGIEWIQIPGIDRYLVRNATKSKQKGDLTQLNLSPEIKDMTGNQRLLTTLQPGVSDGVIIKYNGVDSVIAPIDLGNGNIANTRCGSEIIIVAKAENGRKAMLFVRNPKKDGFYELPGGGLYTLSDTFKKVAEHRLGFKAGLGNMDFSDLKDTGKGLLLNEQKTAKDKSVTWAYSYYRLFTAKYNRVLTDDDISGYSFDNRELAKELSKYGETGYTCYLTWVYIDELRTQSMISARYAQAFDIIRNLAKEIN